MTAVSPSRRRAIAALAGTAVLAGTAARAQTPKAASVRVGKPSQAFAFAVIEAGRDAKIWDGVGLEIEPIVFAGDAKIQQALTAGSLDFGLGSGPAMAYRTKGVPATAVAVTGTRPQDLALIVGKNAGIKTIADLKGKKIAVTTAGSLTEWLGRELSRRQGWGPEGIDLIEMGSAPARVAAMKTGDIAGSIQDLTSGLQVEELGDGRVFIAFGDFVKDFITHVVFARDDLIAQQPDVVRRFLQGWFRTVAYMRSHKDFTIASTAKTTGYSLGLMTRTYELGMTMMSPNGVFDPPAVETVRRSLKELGLVETTPDASALYTPKFVPVRV